MRRAGSDLKGFKSRGGYTEVCVCMYVLSHWRRSSCTPTPAHFRDCFSHCQSSPQPWGCQSFKAPNPALLTVLVVHSCSAQHVESVPDKCKHPCSDGRAWGYYGRLYPHYIKLYILIFIFFIFFFSHSQHCLLAFSQFAVWLCSWCCRFWSSVYCLCMSLSLDVFWDVSAWKIQHKYRT